MRIHSTTKPSSLLKLITYNTFKHRISNYQIYLHYIIATAKTYIKNTPFHALPPSPSLPAPSPLPPPTPDILVAVLHSSINPKDPQAETVL